VPSAVHRVVRDQHADAPLRQPLHRPDRPEHLDGVILIAHGGQVGERIDGHQVDALPLVHPHDLVEQVDGDDRFRLESGLRAKPRGVPETNFPKRYGERGFRR
jgi:hypothetical protein